MNALFDYPYAVNIKRAFVMKNTMSKEGENSNNEKFRRLPVFAL